MRYLLNAGYLGVNRCFGITYQMRCGRIAVVQFYLIDNSLTPPQTPHSASVGAVIP